MRKGDLGLFREKRERKFSEYLLILGYPGARGSRLRVYTSMSRFFLPETRAGSSGLRRETFSGGGRGRRFVSRNRLRGENAVTQ